MNWFLMALKNYVGFSGRSRRSEYWYFTLFYLVIAIVLSVLDGILFGGSADGKGTPVLSGLFMLAMLLPSVAVGIRRLHDTDRIGWWLLIGMIPILGAIVLIVFFVQDSKPGDNRFGPNPKGVAA